MRQQKMFTAIRRWQQSGLSRKTWCENNKIAYATFHYWYKRFRTAELTDNKNIRANSFVQLVVDDQHAGICYCELAFADGKKLLFHQPVTAEFLKALLN